MSREEDLHLITAYALGELDGPEKVRIENLVRNDQILQQTVREIRKTAGFLAADLSSPAQALSSSERLKVDEGWKKNAAQESRRRFYRRTLGAVSAMAAAVFAFAIVRPNVEQFSKSPAEVQLSAPAPAPADKDVADSDRNATFVKIEKKEVNAEVGAKLSDSGAKESHRSNLAEDRIESPQSGVGGSFGGYGKRDEAAKGKAARSADAPAAAPMMAQGLTAKNETLKKGAPRPVSVLFGGDGEVVSGAPDANSVKEKLRERTGEFTACYSGVLENQPGTKGKLILKWGIKKGRATSVSTASSTLGNATLETCITNAVKDVHFGPESNGAKVVMPFHFMTPN